MKTVQVEFQRGFNVLLEAEKSQAAVMVLAPGGSTGGPENRHEESDQWLYVVAGEGRATIAGQAVEFATGAIVLIEKGETHEITNTGDGPLQTINVYVPPAY